MTPDTQEWVIRRICDHLSYDDPRRDRIADGCRYLFTNIENDAVSECQRRAMNSHIVPVFTRLVWQHHRVDIPVDTYASEVQAFMEGMLAVNDKGDIHPSIILKSHEGEYDDPEAAFLAYCEVSFKAGFDELYPLI